MLELQGSALGCKHRHPTDDGCQCLFFSFKLLIPEGQRRPRRAKAIRFDLIQDFICFVEGTNV